MTTDENVQIETDDSMATANEDIDLSLEDLEAQFVAHPRVGEETPVMEVRRFYKTKDVNKVDSDGGSFSIALKTKDGKGDVAYILDTDLGDYTVGSWEEFYKLRDIFKEAGKIEGVKVQIKHIVSGMTDKKASKEQRCYEVLRVE